MMNLYSKLFGPVAPVLGVDVVILLVGVAGLGLNGLLVWITLRRRAMWAIDSLLMLIVAGADLISCGFVVGSVGGRRVLGTMLVEGGFMCGVGSILFCVATATTLIFSALLAYVRYLAFVRNKEVSNQKITLFSYLLLGGVWLLFFLRGLTSEMTPVPSAIYCTLKFWGDTAASRLFGSVALLLMLPPAVLLPVFYSLITRHYSRLAGDANGMRTKMMYVIVAYPAAIFPEFLMVFANRIPGVVRYALPDGIIVTLLFSVTILNALFALCLHAESNSEFLSLARSSLSSCFPIFTFPSNKPNPTAE